MPLVDNGELHQQDEGGNNVVEVILAVVEIGERRVVQLRVPTIGGGRIAGASVEEGHLALEQLHPHHGKYVVDHLEKGVCVWRGLQGVSTVNVCSWRSVQSKSCV